MRILLPLIIFSLSSLYGCKDDGPDDSGTIKTVDNFATDSFTWNDCRASGATSSAYKSKIEAGRFLPEVEKALARVPAGLQKAFFDAPINGRIVLTNNIASQCPSASEGKGTSEEINDQTLSCIKSGGDKGPITIYMQQNSDDTITQKTIWHSVVRGFGYALSEVIADTLPNSDSIKRTADEFGIRLLNDTAAMGIDLNRFSHMLPANLLGKMSDAQRRTAWEGTAAAAKSRFNEAVLAEVFDSVTCSSTSLASMKSQFPQTAGKDGAEAVQAESMEDYLLTMTAEDAIAQIVGGLADAAAGLKPENTEGMGLWGRWGRGNGPLRQGTRNWGNWRRQGNGLFNARRWNSGGGYIFRRPWFAPGRWGRG